MCYHMDMPHNKRMFEKHGKEALAMTGSTRRKNEGGRRELPEHGATPELKRKLLDAAWLINDEKSLRVALQFLNTLKK